MSLLLRLKHTRQLWSSGPFLGSKLGPGLMGGKFVNDLVNCRLMEKILDRAGVAHKVETQDLI